MNLYCLKEEEEEEEEEYSHRQSRRNSHPTHCSHNGQLPVGRRTCQWCRSRKSNSQILSCMSSFFYTSFDTCHRNLCHPRPNLLYCWNMRRRVHPHIFRSNNPYLVNSFQYQRCQDFQWLCKVCIVHHLRNQSMSRFHS